MPDELRRPRPRWVDVGVILAATPVLLAAIRVVLFPGGDPTISRVLVQTLSVPTVSSVRDEVTAKPTRVDDVIRAAEELSALPTRSGRGSRAVRTKGQRFGEVERTHSLRTEA